ncbi:MAG: accessory factor UbiK family protein [Thiotrichales bacterium]|nr:accessory factor UbiK family protein [Thiotrichales bacterium]
MNVDKLQIDEVVDTIRKLLPEDAGMVRNEIQQKIKTALIAGLKNMDLVTREEFDIQARLLARTRAKLDELEAQVENLEKR